MSDLDKQIKAAAEKSILHMISGGAWASPDYANRWKIPADFMAGVWGLVDQEKLKEQMARRIEQELADRIVNHLAAEMSTDIKQILSNPERREALRALARNHMDAICQTGV